MSNSGAIFIGNNLLNKSWFGSLQFEGTGWADTEKLLTPELNPFASYEAQSGIVGIEARSSGLPPVQPNSFALLGTDVNATLDGGFIPNLTVEVFTGGWVQVTDYTLWELAAPDSPRHLVVVINTELEGTRWRLRWQANGQAGKVGSIYVGRAVVGPQLADQGYVQRYIDRAAGNESEDGQIFRAASSVRRELRITQGSMDQLTAFGIPPITQPTVLPTPSLSGSVALNSGVLSVGASQQGSAVFAGVMTPGKRYRIDYRQRHVGNPIAVPRFSVAAFSATSLGAVGNCRGSIAVQALQSSLTIAAGSDTGTSYFEIEQMGEIETPQLQWSVDSEFNLQQILASHGQSDPIIVMVRPSDPLVNSRTGIYGYINAPVDLTDIEGSITRSGLTIREQR
jgi:hypothetical protein